MPPPDPPKPLSPVPFGDSAIEPQAAEWDREHPDRADPSEFACTILPGLQDVPLSALMKATGLSLRYCSLVRRGLRMRH